SGAAQKSGSRSASFDVYLDDVFDLFDRTVGNAGERLPDDIGYLQETRTSGKECRNRNLVRGIQDDRVRSAPLKSFARKRQRGESLRIRRLEGEPADRR